MSKRYPTYNERKVATRLTSSPERERDYKSSGFKDISAQKPNMSAPKDPVFTAAANSAAHRNRRLKITLPKLPWDEGKS